MGNFSCSSPCLVTTEKQTESNIVHETYILFDEYDDDDQQRTPPGINV